MLRLTFSAKLLGLFLTIFMMGTASAQMDTITLKSNGDSYADIFYPSGNYGSDTLMRAGVYDSASGNFGYTRSYVHFDLSSIPANAVIYSATLKFHIKEIVGDTLDYKVRRLLDSLDESTVTIGNQPDFSEFDADIVLSSTQAGSVYSFEVNAILQRIVGGAVPNYGWLLQSSNEAYGDTAYVDFYTSEYSDSDYHPELVISYYLPHQLANVVITHESDTLAGDGSIDLDLLGGTQDFTWEWRDVNFNVISTDTILESVGFGWYGLHVQGVTYPEEHFYYSFLVGTEGYAGELECYFKKYPYEDGENFFDVVQVKDLVVGGLDYRDQNEHDCSIIGAERTASSGVWYTIQTYFKLRLWVDEELSFENAHLRLEGAYHYNQVGNVLNDVELRMLAEDWDPNTTCFNNAPASVSTFSEYRPTTMENGTYNNYLDWEMPLLNFVNYWKQDNTKNYGWILDLYDDYDYYHRQRFHSSYNPAYLNNRRPILKVRYGVFPDPPTFSMNDTTNTAGIDIDISEVASEYTPPYYYHVSNGNAMNIDSLLAIYGDTINFPGLPDSLLGAVSNNATTASFEGMTPNRYVVTVYDSTGGRILQNTLLVQDSLEFDEETGLYRSDLNEVRAMDVDVYGSLDYYVSEDAYSAFTIELQSSSEKQFYGYANIDSTVNDTSDIYYGFYTRDDTAFIISNGSVGNMLAEITPTSSARIVNENNTLRIEIDGVTVDSSTAPSVYQYKVGVMTQPAAPFKFWQVGMVPIKKLPYTIKTKTPSKFTCDGDLGYFTFSVKKVKGDPGYTVTYSVDDWLGNTILSNASTNTGTTTTVSLDANSNPIEPGLYTVYGTINSSPSINFTTTVFVGYDAGWAQETDYDVSGVYEERDAFTDFYASARSTNVLKFNENGIIEFTVETPSTVNSYKHFIRFSTDYPSTTPADPELLNTDFLSVLSVSGTDYLQLWEGNQSFTSPGTALLPMDRVRIELTTLNGAPDKVNVYVNNQLKESISRNNSTNIVRINTAALGDRFKDVMTSFGCPESQDLYAHLDYKLDGYYHVMKDGMIRFIFDQQYDTDDLVFNIYNDHDELVKTESDFSSISTTYGDNYLTIDVSDQSHCIGRGFFYLEVITSKKEKMYLRFFNDHSVTGCVDTYAPPPAE